MRKKERMIKMPEKKAYSIGILLSLVFAILTTYFGIDTLIDAGLMVEKAKTVDLIIVAIPIIFVVFLCFIFGFILICTEKN